MKELFIKLLFLSFIVSWVIPVEKLCNTCLPWWQDAPSIKLTIHLFTSSDKEIVVGLDTPKIATSKGMSNFSFMNYNFSKYEVWRTWWLALFILNLEVISFIIHGNETLFVMNNTFSNSGKHLGREVQPLSSTMDTLGSSK